MSYFIEKPNTWRAANRKCAEIQKYVCKLKNCLIEDDLSRDALVEWIRNMVEELNITYPRTKRLSVTFSNGDFVSCQPAEPNIADEYVFTFRIHPVERIYSVAKKADDLKEGGEK
jgi:hypothetical protein